MFFFYTNRERERKSEKEKDRENKRKREVEKKRERERVQWCWSACDVHSSWISRFCLTLHLQQFTWVETWGGVESGPVSRRRCLQTGSVLFGVFFFNSLLKKQTCSLTSPPYPNNSLNRQPLPALPLGSNRHSFPWCLFLFYENRFEMLQHVKCNLIDN